MDKSRREFLMGTAWMGVAAMAAGHLAAQAAENRPGCAAGAPMHGLSEFSTVYCDPHSQRLWHSQ